MDCLFYAIESLGNGPMCEQVEVFMLPSTRKGLEYALSLKPQIVSMSLSGTFFPELEHELARYAFMLTSAGNYGDKGESYAARTDWWCAVGAVDKYDKPLWYSSYGFGKVKTVARLPVIGGKERPGTSSTCPVVAGILAHFFSWYKSKTGTYPSLDKVYRFIRENSHDIWEAGEDLRTGFGLLKPPKYYTAEQIRCRVGETKGTRVVFRGDEVITKDIDLLVAPKLIDSCAYIGAWGMFEQTGAVVAYKAGELLFSIYGCRSIKSKGQMPRSGLPF